MTWTRRAFVWTVLVGAAVPAGQPALAESAAEKALYDAAKAEGQLTWYSGILDQPICDKIGQAFTAKYPGVRVNAIKTTSQVAFQRLMQDMKAGAVQSDVLTTTDASHMTFLERKGELTQYVPENAKGLVPALRDFGASGYYQVSWVGLVALVYNSAKVTPENAPKDWPDLADPRWKDRLTFGSPNFSGMVGVWTVAMEDKYGWGYFEKLNKLNPLIGRSIDDAVTTLNSGERIVGAGNPATALRNAAKGNPIAVAYPTSGTLGVLSPSGILKRAKNQNAAKLFMEFLTGPEYSRILAEQSEQPLRPDVAPPAGAKALSDINLITKPVDEIEKKLPPNKEKWRETFG
ncbi:ABC transporter substrate-binding protein [Methylobacterium nonmethylotrophicum]|uniref:Extracellular solute-binding protein n=1 Tax=Methylobacterium nonmethylotrophicum TaxID=1141884 RepID=A0A4Z0NH79_9HYPH|nr:extracellular solute-binding protein [Methylobacterium nonmethylotrophicum]TGD95118.1 extracellular solute-binding protein [Methylobacterium nonmethylotrophicum]